MSNDKLLEQVIEGIEIPEDEDEDFEWSEDEVEDEIEKNLTFLNNL